ncbi:MAG: hypothetical protein ACMZ66_13115 [Thalassospira sp.]|uniref:hypothetical protein n=1 Tax=Thalassospira sp. TaxID=1912094 RepID=UPI003A85F2D1
MSAKKQTIVPVKTLEGRDKKGERVIHIAGVPVEVSAAEAKALIDKKLAVAASDVALAAPVAEPDPTFASIDQVYAAVGQVGEEDFTVDGRPTVEALEKLTGLEVSAKRRDAAWEKYVADQKAASKQS